MCFCFLVFLWKKKTFWIWKLVTSDEKCWKVDSAKCKYIDLANISRCVHCFLIILWYFIDGTYAKLQCVDPLVDPQGKGPACHPKENKGKGRKKEDREKKGSTCLKTRRQIKTGLLGPKYASGVQELWNCILAQHRPMCSAYGQFI